MTIRDLVRAYALQDGMVSAYLGTRIYPELPEKVTYAAGRIQSIDIVRPNHLRGVASLAKARIQIDVFANANAAASSNYFRSSRAMVDWIGAAIRRRLDGFVGLLMDTDGSPSLPVQVWITFDLETEGVDEELHGGLSRHSADYFVEYQTAAGTY